MAKVNRYFVVEWLGYKKGHVTLSKEFRTYDMALIECRTMEAKPENKGKYLMVIRREVKAEPIPRSYEVYGESNYAERKIFEAIAEYQRCNEW